MWKMSGFRRRIISAKPDVWDVKMKYGLYVSYPNSYRERARLHEYPRPTCFVSAHSSNFRWLTDWGFHKRRGSERRRGWLTGRLKIFLLRFTTLRFAYLFIVTAKKKKKVHWKGVRITYMFKHQFHRLLLLLTGLFCSPLSHIVLWAVVMLNLHTVCSFMGRLRDVVREMGANLQPWSTFVGLTLAWFCQAQCVEIPMEQITNVSAGRNDKTHGECRHRYPLQENWESKMGLPLNNAGILRL